MKKLIKSIFVVLMAVVNIFPLQVFAIEETPSEWQDIVLSKEQFDSILDKRSFDSQRATGLILEGGINIDKSGNLLLIVGEMSCSPDVDKCGFKEIIIERKASGTLYFEEYITYKDQYADLPCYWLTKSLSVSSGYYYRITYTMYARKNIFSTQKIEDVSNIIYI